VGTSVFFLGHFFKAASQWGGHHLCSACGGAHLAKSKQAGVGALCVAPLLALSFYQTGCHFRKNLSSPQNLCG